VEMVRPSQMLLNSWHLWAIQNVDENTSSGDEGMLRVGANFSRTGVNRLIRKQIGGTTIKEA